MIKGPPSEKATKSSKNNAGTCFSTIFDGLFSRNSSVIHVSSLMLLRSKKHFRFVTSLNSLGQQVRVIYEYTEGIFFCNLLRLLKVDIERCAGKESSKSII